MEAKNTKDVQLNVHNLPSAAQLHMESGCKFSGLSMKAFTKRLVDKFWADYGDQITSGTPQLTYNNIFNPLIEKFYDSERYIRP